MCASAGARRVFVCAAVPKYFSVELGKIVVSQSVPKWGNIRGTLWSVIFAGHFMFLEIIRKINLLISTNLMSLNMAVNSENRIQ